MANEKIRCADCNVDITRNNYNRHFKSQKHIKNSNIKLQELNKLKDCAVSNQIYIYDTLTRDQLKELKSTFSGSKTDYNLFNEEKLRDIGKKLSIRNFEKLNREQLINRINKIKCKPSILGLRSLKYIKEITTK